MKNQITFVRRALSMTIALTMMLSMSLMASAQSSEQDRDRVVVVNETVEITHAAAVQAARDATKAAEGTDHKAVVRFKNPGIISLKTLQDMDAVAGSVNMSIWGDSYLDDTNSVDVRVYINPAYAKGDLDLSGSTTSARADKTADHFVKYFGNGVAVVSLGQQSDFNHNINVAAKLDLSNMNISNLHFYAYDKVANSYRKIHTADQYIDGNGYLCFTTPYGGDIVVSDGVLGNQSASGIQVQPVRETIISATTTPTTAMTDDADQSQALLVDINAKRTALAKGTLSYDSSLETAANAYAQALSNGGSAFRSTTDYLTLPSGEAVHTLFTNANNSINIHNFDYIVFQDNSASGSAALANHIEMMKATDLYQTKAIQGDFTKIGIACDTGADVDNSFTVVIMMFYNDTVA